MTLSKLSSVVPLGIVGEAVGRVDARDVNRMAVLQVPPTFSACSAPIVKPKASNINSLTVSQQPSKLRMRVRFSLPAQSLS